jgi:ABC-type nickel/cobalt efflux system permease component RcnA
MQAFYLTYGPMKPKYLEDFWSIVNWKQVNLVLRAVYVYPFIPRTKNRHPIENPFTDAATGLMTDIAFLFRRDIRRQQDIGRVSAFWCDRDAIFTFCAVHTHTHTRTHTHTHIHTHTQAHKHTHTQTYIHTPRFTFCAVNSTRSSRIPPSKT